MAKIINIEKSKYINENIAIYAANKVGQYSKFLNTTPVFWTYYSINVPQSRTDVGTGGVHSEMGPNSPIRYNKINNLPIYNFPALKPDVVYDETGFNIDFDLNGMTILPGTVIPKPGDYIIGSLPSTKEYAFRVNNFAYNSIQSNDFYQIDADLKKVGTDLISEIKSQVVEEYETIFENIGTEDKCFIRSTDLPKIEANGKLFLEMLDFYKAMFYDDRIGSFVMKSEQNNSGYWFYDMYLEKFIMSSGIYYIENDAKSTILACNDLETSLTKAMYSRTLPYAVLNRNVSYLNDYTYYYQRGILKVLSPFIIYNIPTNGTELLINDKPFITGNSSSFDLGYTKEYYSRELILAMHYPSGIYPDNTTNIAVTYTPANYLEEIIYNYMTNKSVEITKDKLIPYMVKNDIVSYQYLPLVIYIILQYYNSYFKKTEL